VDSCPPAQTWGVERMRAVVKRAARDRIPISTTFDLTHRCNLRCVHCYVGHDVSAPAAKAGELATRDVIRLLEETAAAGCLQVVLSGGEPLLRTDFLEIYSSARRLGLIVQVFTNATLVRESHLDVFAEYPPEKVDVSIYGATEETCARVTGVPGSFAQALRGVHRLLERGIRVGLKSMILSENLNEIHAIEALAEGLGVSFRLDPLVTPRLDGDLSPLALRVEARRGVALELGALSRRRHLREFADKRVDVAVGTRQYACGAARTSFHVDPQGTMRACVLSREAGFPAVDMGVDAAWRALTAATDELKVSDQMKCGSCKLVVVCGYCPTLFALETGSASRNSQYVCELGEARAQEIGWTARTSADVGDTG